LRKSLKKKLLFIKTNNLFYSNIQTFNHNNTNSNNIQTSRHFFSKFLVILPKMNHNCDCCGQKTFPKIARKANYQKLVDANLPKFKPVLEKSLNKDGVVEKCRNKYGVIVKSKSAQERKQKPTPCIVGGADRSGKVRFAQPMPCERFAPKSYWQDPCEKKDVVVCLPCKQGKPCSKETSKPVVANLRVHLPLEKPKTTQKPRQRDYMYRCESRELLASKMLAYCECVKRNGLQDRCPRTPCQGRPACTEKPWPNCWPSGGCHGIDYDRLNGVQRVNPALEYRTDKKICRPPKEESLQQFTVTLENYDL